MTELAGPLPLDWSHETTEIPERALKRSRTATEPERLALSKALDILSCDALEATYQITPIAGGGYRLEGGIDAAVTQACVVSLEPVVGRVAESFSVEFQREVQEDVADGEAQILAAAEVEPIENDRIDVGRIVYETLSAGLDPYPRKGEVAFGWTDPKAADSSANPFAVLKKLKDPG
ncbi:MAG TPA: DUF177 domain-containing protein [Hyphomicrobium sp.]|nr:DUF177 domain-containing protein [Hyphomicrobium sp.]